MKLVLTTDYEHLQKHRETKGTWDLSFPYLNDLEIVHGRDRSIGQLVEGFVDAIHNMEVEEVEGGNTHAMDETNAVVEANSATQATHSNAEAQVPHENRNKKHQLLERSQKKMKSAQAPSLEAQLAEATKQFTSCVASLTSHFAIIVNAMANKDAREQLASTREEHNCGKNFTNLGSIPLMFSKH